MTDAKHEAPAEDDDGPCTCCDDTGITIQTERPCACAAGIPFEAPAEGAGEREALAAIMQRNMIPDDDGGFSFHDLKAADQIMDYLRARSSAPEAREGEAVAWRLLSKERPQPGHKIITLHDDGSGAALLFIHDGGVITSDGDDYDKIGSPQTWWTYLPDGFEFWCEGLDEDAITLPAHKAPIHPAAPSADKLRIAVEALEPFAAFARVAEAKSRMALGKVLLDNEIIASISWEGGLGVLVMGHLRDALTLVPDAKGWGGIYRRSEALAALEAEG